MLKPIIQQHWEWKEKAFRADVYDSSDFTDLSPIKQVYALLINDKKEIAVVYNNAKRWILPGGGTEIGETVLETLVREVKEETNCDISPQKAQPFFYQEQTALIDGQWIRKGYELRYIVPVKLYREFVSDPDNNDITEVKWTSLEDFGKYIGWWGETYEYIMKKLPGLINKLL